MTDRDRKSLPLFGRNGFKEEAVNLIKKEGERKLASNLLAELNTWLMEMEMGIRIKLKRRILFWLHKGNNKCLTIERETNGPAATA